MRVILKQTVPKVGKEGQVVRVKDGFARNFLFPRGMAVVADKSQIRVLEARNKRLEAQLAETKAAADAIGEKLDGKDVKIEVRAGTGQRLFGAVTAQDIADAVKDQLGVEVERKSIGILQPIKQLGHFSIEIDMHRHVDCKIMLHVIDPLAEEEARKAAEVISDMATAGVDEAPSSDDAPTEESDAEKAVEEEATEEEATAEEAPSEE